MNESSRMLMPFSFSFSSIFDWLDLVGADVVDDLDPLPLLHVEDDELADHAVRVADVADLDARSSRKFVAHSRLKSPTSVSSSASS